MEMGKSRWPTRYYPRSNRECCVWQIATSMGMICGKRPATQAPICSGESKRIRSEIPLAHKVLPALKPGMLCLADRNFYGYDLWKKARDSGADLLWRVKKNLRLPCEERLSDGSYLSTVYRSDKDRRRGSHGIRVRVIEYTLEGVAGASRFIGW